MTRLGTRIIFVILASSVTACQAICGYRGGGAMVATTNRTFGAEGIAGAYGGFWVPTGEVRSFSESDIEVGVEASTGVEAPPPRAALSFDTRISWRSSWSKAAIVASTYGGVGPLIGQNSLGEARAGLAFAVQPVVGARPGSPFDRSDEVGFEFQGGISHQFDDKAPKPAPIVGQFAFRIYYDAYFAPGAAHRWKQWKASHKGEPRLDLTAR